MAFDGTNYLVVWQDCRSGTSADIYGARVSRAGAVLDGAGIPISTAANDQSAPAVAFDGTNFLVVWQDGRSGTNSDIYGARVSRAGAVLDGTGIPISTAANDQYAPAVAFDGTNYLVVWQDRRSGTTYDIYGARVSRAGVVREPAGFAISRGCRATRTSPQVAVNGSFLVVWRDRRSGTNWDVYGNRVNGAGGVLDGDGFAIAKSPTDEQSTGGDRRPRHRWPLRHRLSALRPRGPLRLEPGVPAHLTQVAGPSPDSPWALPVRATPSGTVATLDGPRMLSQNIST